MICIKCNLDKGTDFRKNRQVCRECDNEIARENRKKLKEASRPDSILCKECGLRKTEFRINRGTCLDCERANGRKYRKETDKAKIWATENKEQMSQLQHNWYDRNKGEIVVKLKQRYKDDEHFKQVTNHRTALRSMLKAQKNSKSKYVNCDSNTLRKWLEFQFTDEMSFNNHGNYWVIDHVIPIHTFLSGKYSENVVLNWLNVCPILKHSNLTKNKYIDSDQCLEHLENIREYSTEICEVQDTNYISILSNICL